MAWMWKPAGRHLVVFGVASVMEFTTTRPNMCKAPTAVSGIVSKVLRISTAGLLLSALAFVPRAQASIYTLLPGDGITPASSAYPTGASILESTNYSFMSATLDGTVTSTVYTGDTSNPYGGLTFTYLVTLLSPQSTDSADELTVGGFGGFQTDVSYNLSGSEVAPAGGPLEPGFSRSDGTGDVLEFFWSANGGILPGETGALIVVQTSAQNAQVGMGGIIDSVPANVAVYAPVPEPAIGSLFATGLAALFVFRRRSSR